MTHTTHADLHESKLPFVSRIKFIRSKLPYIPAHVSGVSELLVWLQWRSRPVVTSAGCYIVISCCSPQFRPQLNWHYVSIIIFFVTSESNANVLSEIVECEMKLVFYKSKK